MKILATVIACVIVLVLAGVAFIYSGIYNVSAIPPDNALVAWALHTTFDRSVDARLDGIKPPANLESPQNVSDGAHFFRANCVICHGGPDLPVSVVSAGLRPEPPYLLSDKRHNDPVEMFWIIKNGVRMSAMPSFGKTQSDEQIWNLAAFLHHARGISAQEFQKLTTGPTAQPGAG